MSHEIRRVAVLGAGVMGSGIATHLANAGIPSYLYDLSTDVAEKGLKAATKVKPASLFRKADASLITPCNYDDDGDKLAECDWIVEVVVERLDIKQKVFDWVAKNRRPGSIVSSNTSGIKLADMAADMPEEMRQRFLITHFFNPVRYMRLLEIVEGPETDAGVVATMDAFCDRVLGKGVVFGKDTPNFIANRIGTYGMASVFKHMVPAGLTVEQVDAIFGPALGRPKSAVFRTADVVGLDTLAHVFRNLYDYLVDDEEREVFALPDAVDTLLADGRSGAKAGAGFYKKVKEGGKSKILALDLETLDYREQEKVRFESTGKARKAEKLADKIRVMVNGEDAAGKIAWTVTADTLLYSAKRIPEIADDVVAIDNAMKWGFGWDAGPFETWDMIGVAESVERMKGEGRAIPAWVEEMLASGRTSFYARDENGEMTAYKPGTGVEPVKLPEGVILLKDVRSDEARFVERTASASLLDLGDGVLGLEFHSKMNSLDELIFGAYGSALDKLDAGEFEALVVGNQDGKAFSAGANALMILMNAMQGNWDAIDGALNDLQSLLMRAKYSKRPVVTAPYAVTLGGGLEVAMQSSATQAHGELYAGLVEVGLGLIPGGGGCKEVVVRYLGDIPQDIDYDPNPFVMKAFERIGLAKVTSSAEEARDWGYLRPTDRITMNSERLIADAKATALGLVKAGYTPPRQRTVKVPGPTGRAAIELFLYGMAEGNFATPHDLVVGKKLAHVMTGGDVPWGTVRTEQDLLDLEREAFLSLCGTEAHPAAPAALPPDRQAPSELGAFENA